MPHPTPATNDSSVERVRAVGLLVVTLLTMALAGRAAWLLVTSPTTTEPAITKATPTPAETPSAPPAKASAEQPTLTVDEVAMLNGLCPTALSAVPPEWLPPEVRAEPTATGPRAHITGLRLASKGDRVPRATDGVRIAQVPPAPRADGWLVAPEEWYAPEDAAARLSQPSAVPAAPVEPPAEAEPEPPALESEERAAPTESVDPWAAAPPAPVEGSAVIEPTEPPAPAPPSTREWPVEPETPRRDSAESDPQQPQPVAVEPAEIVAPRVPIEPPTPEPATDLFSAPVVTEPEPPITPPAPSGPSFAPPGVALPPSADPAADLDLMVDELAPPPEESAEEPTPPQAEVNAVEPWAPIEPFDVEAAPPAVGLPPQPKPKPKPVVEAEPASPTGLLGSPQPVEEPERAPVTIRALELPPTLLRVEPEGVETPSPEAENEPKPPSGLFAPPALEKPSALFTPPSPHGAGAAAEARAAANGKSADEAHRELFAKNCYPSAKQCAECHQRTYDEWSVSSHAYAFVSPMFHKFEEKLTQLSLGTVGHFCYRCHSPIATAMGEMRSTPVGDLAEVAREGVTCIACHRVNQRWGKSNGERRVVPGDIYNPIYGGLGGDGVAKAIAEKDKYKVKTSPDEKGPGQPIHTEGRFFDQLTQAEACTSCHQVAVHPGVKLEVVWEQYRASPACKKGVTCQECHMGRVPGMAGGYDRGPVAVLNGKTVDDHRKHSNHVFYGPGYSIAHPGVFPQHKDAAKWTMNEWLLFDWRAGWGTDDFEDHIDELEDRGVDTSGWFPPVWRETDDRCDAREVVDDNLDRLKTKRRYRELVMENGSHVDGPFFRDTPVVGRDLKFDYVVANKNEGHNLPTASLGAQPQLWANVVLIGPDGRRLWETGYTDSHGDLADIHSVDVRKGRVPFDKQLFNLQTMFLITGATGTDRELPLPVNISIDQVPHLRPGTIPITVTNHPPFIRMEGRSIAPLGKKRVKYTVPGELLCQPGRYRLSFRLRSRTEPMYFMRFCDATPEMLRAMTEGTLDIHPYSVEFDVLP